MARTYHITTLGCPKNEADTRAMRASLDRDGLVAVDSPERADLHIINSCAFVEEARLETIDTVFEAAELKEEHGSQKLVLAGCFAERYATEVASEMPEVDFAFGTGRYGEASALIRESFGREWSLEGAVRAQGNTPTSAGERRGGRSSEEAIGDATARATNATGPAVSGPAGVAQLVGGAVSAPVKVSDGCDRACAFCAIPLFRGGFAQRPVGDIVAECRDLAAGGVREICLVSQDTIAFGPRAEDLVDLLEELHTVDGLAWLRLLYLYPDRRTERLLNQLAERQLPKVVPYFESPVQHVSRPVLKAMNRAGSYEQFVDLFALARAVWPEAEIRTTFLLGFPGETSRDVDRLLDFVEEARPEKLALFPYSVEEGTAGAAFESDLSRQEVAGRINLVRSRHLEVLRGVQRDRMGRAYDCLIEQVGTEVIGRRPQDAPEADEVVYVEGLSAARPGDILRVRITGFYEYDMIAVPTALREPG